jgi:hypothetical protein
MEITMLEYLGRNWGWVVLRGVAAVLFGLLAFAWPGITLAALVIVWGAYALVDGVLALIAACRVRDRGRPFWALLIVGLLGIAAGIVTFLWRGCWRHRGDSARRARVKTGPQTMRPGNLFSWHCRQGGAATGVRLLVAHAVQSVPLLRPERDQPLLDWHQE